MLRTVTWEARPIHNPLIIREGRRPLDNAAAAIGFGGFFIAALSLVLSYRDRSSHRSHFYERQIEAYSEVITALDNLYDQVQDYINERHFVLDAESRNQLRREMSMGSMQKTYFEFITTHRKCSLFLPQPFLDSLGTFNKVLNGISAPSVVAHKYPPELVEHKDPQMPLSEAYRDVVAVARHGLGVDPLSKDMLRLFGDKDPDRELDPNLTANKRTP